MNEIYGNLPQLAAESLRKKAERVVNFETNTPDEWRLKFSDLTTDAVKEMLAAMTVKLGRKHQSIYVFSLLDDAVDSDLRDAFNHKDADRAFARLNRPEEQSAYGCIYVGSSHDTAKRIRDHLGHGYPRTYSLHLNCWAKREGNSVQPLSAGNIKNPAIPTPSVPPSP